jgi:hypothetical protein
MSRDSSILAREAFERHLEVCPACRVAVDAHAAIKTRLGGLRFSPVSSSFAERVRARVSPTRLLDFANWRIWTLRLAPAAGKQEEQACSAAAARMMDEKATSTE